MTDSAWISVADELPDDEITVLIALSDGEVWTGYRDGDRWLYVSGYEMQASVTHWMNLSEPPP
jgi:hypothetical protein